MAVRYDGDKKTILLACEKAGLSMSDFIVGASLKTRNVGVKNEPKTFLNLKKERAMNEKYTDFMEKSINAKEFHIEEWNRVKARLKEDLESRNLKIPIPWFLPTR